MRIMNCHRTILNWLAIATFGAIAVFSHSDARANGTPFRLAWFQADVTVPIGHRLMGIFQHERRE